MTFDTKAETAATACRGLVYILDKNHKTPEAQLDPCTLVEKCGFV